MPRQRSLLATGVAAAIAIAIGIVLSYTIHWFPVQASTQAKNTDRLYHVLVIVSIPIFVLVVTTILYSVWQFRMKPGEELKDGPPIHGNTRLEVLWTTIPAVLLLGLVSYSFVILNDNEKKPSGVPEIQVAVTGQQFFWSYEYPASVTGGALPRDTRPAGRLSGGLQPAVRGRALADALGGPRRLTRSIPGVAEESGERRRTRRDLLDRTARPCGHSRHQRRSGCG
jgi:heme/copper-type cytochrome/quinol oxidase subunit 2